MALFDPLKQFNQNLRTGMDKTVQNYQADLAKKRKLAIKPAGYSPVQTYTPAPVAGVNYSAAPKPNYTPAPKTPVSTIAKPTPQQQTMATLASNQASAQKRSPIYTQGSDLYYQTGDQYKKIASPTELQSLASAGSIEVGGARQTLPSGALSGVVPGSKATDRATLINPKTGERQAVDVGSSQAQDLFGQGYILDKARPSGAALTPLVPPPVEAPTNA